jgi:hypothetical protein
MKLNSQLHAPGDAKSVSDKAPSVEETGDCVKRGASLDTVQRGKIAAPDEY